LGDLYPTSDIVKVITLGGGDGWGIWHKWERRHTCTGYEGVR